MTAIAEDPARNARPTVDRRDLSHALLTLELRRLRLLLHRRVLWLRRRWAHDPLHRHRDAAITDAEADVLLADRDERDEEDFYVADPAASGVGLAIHDTDDAISVGRAELEEAGAVHAIDQLARLFRLTRFERDVVLLGAAPDLDPSFERLLAYVQDDADRVRPTPFLALALLAMQRSQRLTARDTLGPAGTLRRARLVTIDEDRSSTAFAMQALRVDERIVDYVRGVNRLDTKVVDLLRPLPPPLLTPWLAELAAKSAAWLAAATRGGAAPAVNIVGEAAWGRRELAAVLCEELSLRPTRLDVDALTRLVVAERGELLRLLERESVLLRLAFYIEVDDADGASPATTPQQAMALVENIAAPLVIASVGPLRLERGTLCLTLRAPRPEEQRTLWSAALGDSVALPDEVIDGIIEQFDLGPTMIAEAVARSRAAVHAADPSATVGAEDLWRACRELTGSPLKELAQRLEPRYDWDDLVLPAAVVRHLRDLAAQVSHRTHVYERLGFGAKLGRGRGISALFAGPSGTGKTMAAEVMARELTLDLYRIDLSVVIDKYVGETEKRLRRVFDAAERSGAILFFDEADALFGKRSEVRDSHDRYANIEIDYLLQRMEDYRGLAILATNRKASLDRAFLRRLRFLVDFPFPDVEQRRHIWRRVFPTAVSVTALDFDFLSRLDLSGGNIRNIVVNAAFLAAQDDECLGMKHVVNAASREMAKMDRVVGPSEFGRYQELLS
jgi:SpoVK/Ycf46/Vps4 family AAA+-type ATPase